MSFKDDISEAKSKELNYFHKSNEDFADDIIESNKNCWSCHTEIPVGKKYCEIHCDHPADEFDSFTGQCEGCGKSLNVNMMMRMPSVESKSTEAKIERSDGSMTIDGKQVIKIWESMQGWYWYAVEDQGEYTGVGADGNDIQAHAWFGYVQADFNEWGTFDSKELERAGVWTVPKSNWGWTGVMEESYASEVNGYIAYYDGQQTEIYADTSYDAQRKGIDFFNPPESKKHTVTVMIAEKDGEQVTHTFTESKASEYHQPVLIKGKPSKDKLRDEFSPYVYFEDEGENTWVIFDELYAINGKQELENLGYTVIGEAKASEGDSVTTSIHGGTWDTDEDEAIARAKWNPTNKCGQCNKTFDSVQELKDHVSSSGVHYPTGESKSSESEDVFMYDGTGDVDKVGYWWDFELPVDEMKHEQLSSILGIDVNTAWGFMTPAEQERVKNYKLNRMITNEAQLMKEINDGWEFSVIDHGYGGGNMGNSPDKGLLEVGIFSPDVDPVMGVQKSVVQGYMTQADVDGLLSTFRTDPAVAFRSIGGEWEFDGQKGLEYQSDIERID